MYSYQLNKEKEDWVRIQLGPKRRVEEILQEKGFKVQSNISLTGSSGVKHPVDIYAADRGGEGRSWSSSVKSRS